MIAHTSGLNLRIALRIKPGLNVAIQAQLQGHKVLVGTKRIDGTTGQRAVVLNVQQPRGIVRPWGHSFEGRSVNNHVILFIC